MRATVETSTTGRAIVAHRPSYADPIRLRAGEELAAVGREGEHPGWLWCTNRRGASGWVPAAAVALRPRDGWQEKEES